MAMKMCKYCGGIVKGDGFGRFGVYCRQKCADAVEGFDKKLDTERRDGKNGSVSLDAFMAKGGDLSDGGEAMDALYDRLDGTEPKYNPKMDVADVMRKAADISPLLPAILSYIGQGWTQERIAKKLKITQGRTAQLIKSFHASIKT